MKDQHFSGLTARFKLDKIDDVPATVSLTASLSFWKEAAANLTGDSFGAWQVRAAIREVVDQAQTSFYHRLPSDEEPR